MKVADLIRKHGISEQTFYRWKSKYGGMEVNEAKRLRVLEEGRRDMADYFEQDFGMSQRRASSLAQVSRSVLWYRSKRGPDSDVRKQLNRLAWSGRASATAD